MNKNILVSVILPVYNVEKYLECCIDSLVHQTYKFIEIIIVDDGAQDNSGEIADRWAARDTRIKVVHKENGGVASARNVGLKNASGDFVIFVDPDDWIEPQLLEKLYECLLITWNIY